MGERRVGIAVLTAAALGSILVVVGVFLVYPPAALIVAGAAMVTVAVRYDDGKE